MIAPTTVASLERGEFAREMRRLRGELGLSQADACTRAGLSRERWNQLERDREYVPGGPPKSPTKTPEAVYRVAHVLGWDMADAFAKAGLDFDPNEPPPVELPKPAEEATFVTLWRGLPGPMRDDLLRYMRKAKPHDRPGFLKPAA